MSTVFRPPSAGNSPRPTLSIRARLLVLALIAVVPLMVDRARRIETDRAERIAALSEDARALARAGAESQRELIIAVKAVAQVVARAYTTLASSSETCSRFLADATTDAPWIAGLSIIGANGRVICSTAAKSVGLDVSDRPYFQRALREKSFIVSADAVGRSRGAVGMIAAVPTLAADGSASGVITAGFELQWIDRIATEVARRPGAMMLIVDPAGTVLAAEPGEANWQRKKLDAPDLLREIGTHDGGLAAATGPDGVRRSFGYTRLPDTSAFLAVGLGEAEMLRRVDREMQLAYLQFALIGAFVLFGVWFGGEHTIVRPLRALARMAVHVGHGNLAVRAGHRRWAPEFAPLASALDAMAQRLTAREEELKVANAHLDQLARIDSLSGLTNRRGFDAKLDEEWSASARTAEPLALVMIDVDHFKAFNDRYGHVAGDMCLRTVSEALASAVREATLVARYGGEEFALLFAATTLDRALEIAERLRATVEQLNLTHQAAPLGRVTASIGVAALRARADESCAMLIEAADAALYGAKRRGRNAVVGHGVVTQFAQIA